MAQFNTGEILLVAKEGIKALSDIRGVGVFIDHAADDIDIIAKKMPRPDTQRGIIGQINRAGTGGKRQVHKVQPGAGQPIDVDKVGGIEKATEHHSFATVEALAPIQVGEACALITERWLGEPGITDITQIEVTGRGVTVTVPVL